MANFPGGNDDNGLVARAANGRGGPPIEWSDELARILALPRRPPVIEGSATSEALIELCMDKLSRGERECRCADIKPVKPCVKRFFHIQGWCLHEASVASGLVTSAATGSGKCVDAATEVFDYTTSRRRRVAELGQLSVATFNKTLSPAAATAFASGEKECVAIALADGAVLTLSTDHPVLTHRGWINAADLLTTDYAAVAVEMPEPTTPTPASDAEVKFVAYMSADGGCSTPTMHFTNMTTAVIADWMESALALGYTVRENKSRSSAREFVVLRSTQGWAEEHDSCVKCRQTTRPHSGRGLCRRCYQRVDLNKHPLMTHQGWPDATRTRWNLNGLSKHKRVHPDIWGLPRHQVALFLNRFWACDGHVSKSTVEITLASEGLIDDIRFLLTRLGIRSRKKFKQSSYVKTDTRHLFDAWRLTFSGNDALKFLTEVGDVLGKEESCQALRQKLNNTVRNTNFDVVPVGSQELAQIKEELPEVSRTVVRNWLARGRYPSRTVFRKFCERFKYKGKYAHLTTSDVAWEQVVSVIPAGTRPVYDLTVPETHNFVANGVVIHNTTIAILAPMVVPNCKLALLLIPSSLKDQIFKDWQRHAEHFRVPTFRMELDGRMIKGDQDPSAPVLRVLPYTKLSSIKASAWISELKPDLVICDEADAIAGDSARKRRVFREFANNPSMRYVGMTGSLTDAELEEMWLHFVLALRERSPVPIREEVVEDWGRAINAVPAPAPAGELRKLCVPGESVRAGFHRRLAETQGVVMVRGEQIVTTPTGEKVELILRKRDPGPLPEKVKAGLALVEKWLRPDTLGGAEYDIDIETPMERARVAMEVCQGMFYKWVYLPHKSPHNNNEEIKKRWNFARKGWFSACRERVGVGDEFMDSLGLVERAAMRGWGDLPADPRLPSWRPPEWPEWFAVRDMIVPTQAAVRLDPYMVDDAAAWSREQNGIIWYSMREFAAWLNERHGIPVFDGGTGERLMQETGERSIAASIAAHGRGRDGLQFLYDQMNIVQFPSSSRKLQQLLARQHRHGQKSSNVIVTIYKHAEPLRRAYDQALRRAEFVEEVIGDRGKILSALKE